MSLSTLSDEDLLVQLQAGQQDALAELYDRHACLMLQVAYKILQNQRDAEDLIHDVLIEAWQKSADYHPERGSVRNWLLIRLRSRGIDRLRSLQTARNYHLLEKQEQTQNTDDDGACQLVDQSFVHDSLQHLPDNQRQIIELSF
ncbi:MAG: sigma-70 family RNA polymerase sigma factor, partial [Pseudomonadales bacterium]|nr:sigma-70 family RNA polymerase sigma factor [Pseudomonadales bacterium]